MRDLSLFVNPKGLPDAAAFMKFEVDNWSAVIKKAGIEPQ